MADGAVLHKELLAVLNVARLLDLGRELGEQRVLFLRLWPAQFIDHFARTFRHRAITVRPETMHGRRPEIRESHLAVLHRLHQRKRPVRALHDLRECGVL